MQRPARAQPVADVETAPLRLDTLQGYNHQI